MVEYNPKDWFGFIFRFHKADTFRKLGPIMIGLIMYGFLMVFLFHSLFHLDEQKQWENFSLVYSILGFVISLLFVFRTNTAYDRWWEGRKQWGSLVNISRSLAQKLKSSGISKDDREDFAALIPNFAFALKNHLRSIHIPEELEDNSILPVHALDRESHVPNQVAGSIHQRINSLYTSGKISDMQFLSMQQETAAMYDILGACERIKNTPIPFSYSSFLKKFIFFYVMLFPFVFLKPMGYFLIPALLFVFYVLASLELIAEEIEDPFGSDANDLPTDSISKNIRKSVHDIFLKFPVYG
ncbi:MAG: hypothetical protein MH137_07790 [Flavobacteriales bacterium]|nr:hypothetical protein [Flavobacteriales bacterium]